MVPGFIFPISVVVLRGDKGDAFNSLKADAEKLKKAFADISNEAKKIEPAVKNTSESLSAQAADGFKLVTVLDKQGNVLKLVKKYQNDIVQGNQSIRNSTSQVLYDTNLWSTKLNDIRWKIVNWGFAASLFTGFVSPFVYLTKTGMEFENQLVRISSVTNTFGSNLNSLSNSLVGMTTNSIFSLNEVSTATLEYAKAGFSLEESMIAMPQIMNLATAGFTNLDTATTIVAATMQAFAVQGVTVQQVVDTIAKAANTSALDVETFGSAFAYVAPIAAELGYSMYETAAAVSVLANAGLRGSRSGTELRQALSSISDPTKQATDAMKSIGVEFYNADSSAKSLTEVVSSLRMSIAGLSEERKAQVLGDIFNVRSRSAIAAFINLIESGGPELDEMGKSLEEDIGYASRKAAEMLTSSVNKMKISINNLKLAIMPLATGLSDMFRVAIDAVSKLSTAFNTFAQENPFLTKLLGGVTAMGAITIAGKFAYDILFPRGNTKASPLYVELVSGSGLFTPIGGAENAALAGATTSITSRILGAVSSVGIRGTIAAAISSATSAFSAALIAVLSNPITWVALGVAIVGYLGYREFTKEVAKISADMANLPKEIADRLKELEGKIPEKSIEDLSTGAIQGSFAQRLFSSLATALQKKDYTELKKIYTEAQKEGSWNSSPMMKDLKELLSSTGGGFYPSSVISTRYKEPSEDELVSYLKRYWDTLEKDIRIGKIFEESTKKLDAMYKRTVDYYNKHIDELDTSINYLGDRFEQEQLKFEESAKEYKYKEYSGYSDITDAMEDINEFATSNSEALANAQGNLDYYAKTLQEIMAGRGANIAGPIQGVAEQKAWDILQEGMSILKSYEQKAKGLDDAKVKLSEYEEEIISIGNEEKRVSEQLEIATRIRDEYTKQINDTEKELKKLNKQLSEHEEIIDKLENPTFVGEVEIKRLLRDMKLYEDEQELASYGIVDVQTFLANAVGTTADEYENLYATIEKVTSSTKNSKDSYDAWVETVHQFIRETIESGNLLSMNVSSTIGRFSTLLLSTSKFDEEGAGQTDTINLLQQAYDVYYGRLHNDVNDAIEDEKLYGQTVYETSGQVISQLTSEYSVRRGITDAIKMQEMYLDDLGVKLDAASADVDKYTQALKKLEDEVKRVTNNIRAMMANLPNVGGGSKAGKKWLSTGEEYLGPTFNGELMTETSPGHWSNESDFISRPGMNPISFSPQDTIVGFKSNNVPNIGQSGGNITIGDIIINGVSGNPKEIANQIAQELRRELRTI